MTVNLHVGDVEPVQLVEIHVADEMQIRQPRVLTVTKAQNLEVVPRRAVEGQVRDLGTEAPVSVTLSDPYEPVVAGFEVRRRLDDRFAHAIPLDPHVCGDP